MRQTSLNLPRVAHAATSPLTSLLSQYELLTMLCENLSSADIVHLGATSREHWQYIGHNPVILKGLISNSTCDGKGIIAQAHVFGHWKADPEKATRECKGNDARPCSDCRAMVCNNCRFHLTYPNHGDGPSLEAEAWHDAWYEDWGLDWDWDDSWDETWDLEEKIIGTAVNDAEILEEDSTRQVELVKAIRMLHMRDQTHCRECEPLIVDSRLSREWCGCNLHSHFVAPWRCIPCVLAEEAHLVASQQKYTMVYDPTEIQRSWAYDKEMFCRCGKRTVHESIQTCRWCGQAVGYYTNRKPYFLKRVQEQLGSATDLERRDDPILSQLG